MAGPQQGGRRVRGDIPALEWAAAGLGLLIVLGLIGFIGWQAWQRPAMMPPAIMVRIERIAPTTGGYLVEVTAANGSPAAAASVEVEGTLRRNGMAVATSKVTLDYVPGRSKRQAGLFFAQDPRSLRLEVRALGYAEP